MAKSTVIAAASKIAVETTIGKLRFRKTPRGAFIVRCRGQERIRIRLDRDSGKWQADQKGYDSIVFGATPELCFKRAVRLFWAN
jgi:hypothetical protein